jgi:hypothetical protein
MPVSKTKGKIAMLLSKYFLKLNNHNNLSYSTLTQILMNVTAPDPARVRVTEITQPCIHMYDGLFICQLYSLPDLLEETDCKEDMPLTLPFCIVRFLLTVDNSDMN